MTSRCRKLSIFSKMPPEPPAALVFDLSEVLIAGLVGLEKILAPRLGCSEPEALRTLGGEGLQALCRGQISEERYLAQVLANTGWKLSAAELKSLIRANFALEVPGMRALIQALLADRARLVLLSDHAAEWAAHIRAIHPFLSGFDPLFFSYEMGQTKRSGATFTRVAQALDLRTQDCLLIDDSEDNAHRAREAGWQAIRFCGVDDLRRQLAQMGYELTGP